MLTSPHLKTEIYALTSFCFTPSPINGLKIAGETSLFPVRRVYCIGRNYAAHSIEMGGNPDREPPFFFQKNPDNLVQDGAFPYPPQSEDVHHEVEMVVALKTGGVDIAEADALEHVYGYAVGLDMTRRDRQSEMKQARRPWEIGKAFEKSAPISDIIPASQCGHISEGQILLHVNGTLKQEGDVNQMVWKVPEMIAYLSRHYTLAAGDIIMTGTPSGVGPVQIGDVLRAEIAGLGVLEAKVV